MNENTNMIITISQTQMVIKHYFGFLSKAFHSDDYRNETNDAFIANACIT